MDQFAFAKDSNVFSQAVESLRVRGIPLIVENIEKEYNLRIAGTEVDETATKEAEQVEAPKKRGKKK